MANFFLTDADGNRCGPYNEQQLQALAAQGKITPTTPLETDTGHKGLAGQIPGLFPPVSTPFAQPAVIPPPTINLFCTNCGTPVSAQAVACMSCGAKPTGHKKFCRHCAAALNPEQVVCTKCGAAIQATNSFGQGNAKHVDANALGIEFWDIIKNKYTMMDGRARRKEFWMFTLWQTLIIWFPMIIGIAFVAASEDYGVGSAVIGGIFIFVGVIFALALLCPSIHLQVRRLHDSGKSGWFWFINLIPYVGGLIFFVLMCLDSQRGDNQYGPNPKGEY